MKRSLVDLARPRAGALLCVALFLSAELISKPFTGMGICDDWSYLESARVLAATGRIVYNGWATALLGSQLYLGALFIKIFGDSSTVIRMSTLMVSALNVFFLQRLTVRCAVSERNATIGTLAFALTPIYMQLSVTFMSDVQGVFAVVSCLYACTRAVQASAWKVRTCWLIAALVSNVVLGSARQTGWLGTLVVVPASMWLLRKDKRTLQIAGVGLIASWWAIYAIVHWFGRQPYAVSEPVVLHFAGTSGFLSMARQMLKAMLETPFLILPILLTFLGWRRRGGKVLPVLLLVVAAGYLVLAVRLLRVGSPSAMLEPLLGDWFSVSGYYSVDLPGTQPVVFGSAIRIVMTIIATLAIVCFLYFLFDVLRSRRRERAASPSSLQPQSSLSWNSFVVFLLPLLTVYYLLLLPRATRNLYDRYLLLPALITAIMMLRLYQDYIQPRLPGWSIAITTLIAAFSIACTHDLFALSRARVVMTDELKSAGIPRTAVNGGFEYNAESELIAAGHINDPRIRNPAHSFIAVDPLRGLTCKGEYGVDPIFRHVVPLYGVAYSPDACSGVLPIAPVRYSRWLLLESAQLYAVKYN